MSEQPAAWRLLIEAGRTLAHVLKVEPASEQRILETIEHVLRDREILELVGMGIITREEGANLLLAHLHTRLYHDANGWPEGEPAAVALVQSVIAGLYGQARRA